MKFIHTLSILFFLSATHLQSSTPQFFKSGYVMGGSVGVSEMHGNFTTESIKKTVIGGVIISTAPNVRHSTKRSSNLVASFLGGYRYVTKSGFSVGFDLGISKDNNTLKEAGTFENGVIFQTKLKRSFQITPALFLGHTISERWMLFAKLGLSISRFNLKSIRTDVDKSIGYNKSFTKIGFAPTLGAEYALNETVSMTGVLSYETFGSSKKNVGSTERPIIANAKIVTENSVKVKPSYCSVKFGVVYKL